jgi:hypothetical protein
MIIDMIILYNETYIFFNNKQKRMLRNHDINYQEQRDKYNKIHYDHK